MPLRVRQAVIGDALECGHVDSPPERGPCCTAGVVEKNHQYIRRARRGFVREKSRPIRFRITDVQVYGSLKASHCASYAPDDGEMQAQWR